jgi:uncharacterized membrane protein YidH (DUF202 family)
MVAVGFFALRRTSVETKTTKRGKTMLGVLLIIFGLLIALLGVWHVLPTDAMATTNSSAWQTILNGITGLATLALVIVTVFMVWYTRCSLEEAQKANERLEKMFIAQIRPLVDVVPRIVVT